MGKGKLHEMGYAGREAKRSFFPFFMEQFRGIRDIELTRRCRDLADASTDIVNVSIERNDLAKSFYFTR